MRTREAYQAIVICLALAAGTSAATAQTSSQLVQSDPRAQYAAVSAVMRQLYDEGQFQGIRWMLHSRTYNLYHCNVGSEYLGDAGDADPTVHDLANLAYDVVIWSRTLERIGYPEAVWGPAIAAYETATLDLLAQPPYIGGTELADRRDAFREALLEVLLRHREDHPELRPVESIGECGAGEIHVRIATEPRGAQVLFIPTFFYELCRAQRLDPEDTVRCNRWREAIDGMLAQVAGDYYYLARWPDGVLRRGQLSFTNLQDEQTVVLRKPVP
jgi:hypothetical protein